MQVKTLYDWAPGGRGHTLAAKGGSPQGFVSVGTDGAVLLEIYRSGGLYGHALVEAERRFGTNKKEGGGE